jgi:hypothetical protein
VETAKRLHLPGPKDRPGWQRFIFGEPPLPSPSESSLAGNNDGVDVVDEPELLATQPAVDLDLDDASTSDEENGPSHHKTQHLVERGETLVSHTLADHGVGDTNPHLNLLPEPSLVLLRRLTQVCIMHGLSSSVSHPHSHAM